MSPKTRRKVPTWVHRRAVARRWFRDAWSELRDLRAEHNGQPVKPGSKPRSGGSVADRVNPWPRCTSCHRRQPAAQFECEEPEHAELCNGCCGCSGGGRSGGGGSGCSCAGSCDCEERDDELDEDEGDEPDEQEPDEQEPGQPQDGGESSDDHH